MVSINKPVDYMHVYVTPEQFAKIYEATKAAELYGYSVDPGSLQRLLSQAAHDNGGVYDAARHGKGEKVELRVIV